MEATDQHIYQAVDHLFRQESGKMVAVLTKWLGLHHLQVAEDIVQDSLFQAMNTWPFTGMPHNPVAWLHRVARNKAIDYIRREGLAARIRIRYHDQAYEIHDLEAPIEPFFLEREIEDGLLRMLFACCHPSITPESQVAMALKVLCGLSVAEIARAFLTQEETIAKRIYRARERMKTGHVHLDLPLPVALTNRLDAVLHCLYLLFNEGYNSSHPEQLIREELCQEAMRLAHLLTGQKETSRPRTYALLALFCFQASRLKARMDDRGNIILLQRQDRALWYRPLIEKGFYYLEAAAAPFEVSPYHLEAGIASLHAAAPTFEQTDWKSIYQLYTSLYHLKESPVVAMNKAIAAGYAFGPEEGLSQLQKIDTLTTYSYYYAAVGEMYFLMHKKPEAQSWYRQALQRVSSVQEQQLLIYKMELCH
jgi:RNA polymerase sigma-70 factor (ECF subfamily)